MELGRPLPVWQWPVVSGETQVLNSNSTLAVQDPPTVRMAMGSGDHHSSPFWL